LNKQMKPNIMPSIPEVEGTLNSMHVSTMASGQVGDELKFYFHCQLADQSGYAMSEIVFHQSMRTISGVIKTTRGDLNNGFENIFANALA